HRDTLTLTTREGLRLAVEVGLEVKKLCSLFNALVALFLADASDLEREAHVVANRHVGVERVVLEHHRDVAVLRRNVGDIAVTDANRTVVDLFEACEHTKRSRLTATRGAHENQELAVGDVEVELVNRGTGAARVDTGSVV